ncbi:mandelate racemase/muconate lactonizing enzyme family protein [Blastococcus sp. URHD0036]|uniref:mandelate racemase/muconate lactonizing enzyme family protein n=1 Tax=Blastococcus sp. URHD0036 TaxID=1380356 RepID=UPI000494FD56|nr:mandelate racemase/muconate lactonizing enzyme family protein [Blastococcus sp. URHD0036]
MKIERIESFPLLLTTAQQTMTFFVVRVTTDDGLVGHGEACDSFGVSHPTVLAAIVDDAFAPLLRGAELTAVEPLLDGVHRTTRRALGDRGVAGQARSALAIALTDLVAQAAGRSVSDLAGRVRDSIRVYVGSSPFLESGPAAEHLDRLAPLLERGIDMVKMRVGLDWRRATDVLADLRGLLGDDVEIAVDGSEFFTLPQAVAIAERLHDVGVTWFEEPLPHDQHEAIARLADRVAVPLAYGEHFSSPDAALSALVAGEMTVVQPDASIAGGIEAARSIARTAGERGARVACHHHAGLVSAAANLHVAASSPAVDVFEFPFHLDPLLAPGFGIDAVVDGALPVPTGPGLGVTLEPGWLAAHRLGR